MLDEGGWGLSPLPSPLSTHALVGNVELLSRPVEDDVQIASLTAPTKVGPTAAGG